MSCFLTHRSTENPKKKEHPLFRGATVEEVEEATTKIQRTFKKKKAKKEQERQHAGFMANAIANQNLANEVNDFNRKHPMFPDATEEELEAASRKIQRHYRKNKGTNPHGTLNANKHF